MNESALLVHVWEVDPGEEAAAIQSLDEMFGELTKDPGFVSAHVLETDDHESIAAIVQMRSAEDRQRLEQSASVRETLDHLHGTANLVVRLYREAASYSA
jgi:heme-degrading monooxygenase HmoA